MNTICKHERAILSYVLNFAASDHRVPTVLTLDSWDIVMDCVSPFLTRSVGGLLAITGKDTSLSARQVAAKRADAWFAVHDPAKLAAIMAEVLRGLGFSVDGDPCDEKQTCVDFDFRIVGTITLITCDPEGYQMRVDCTMPTARALTLKWLACKTTEEAIAAMGSVE